MKDKQTAFPYQFDHVRIACGQQIGTHQQPTWELTYIIRGSGMRTIGTEQTPFQRGELVLVRPQQLHGWKFEPPKGHKDAIVENISLSFDATLFHRLAAMFPEIKADLEKLSNAPSSICFGRETTRLVAAKLLEMEQQIQPLQLLTVGQILLLLVADHDRQQVGSQPEKSLAQQKLEQIDIFLRCNFMRQATLADVALHVGMNRSSLCSFYKRQTGQTIFSALTSMRIGYACNLLRQTHMAISTVCYRCGFNDVPYFNRTFKRLTGMSPTAFQRSHATALNLENA